MSYKFLILLYLPLNCHQHQHHIVAIIITTIFISHLFFIHLSGVHKSIQNFFVNYIVPSKLKLIAQLNCQDSIFYFLSYLTHHNTFTLKYRMVNRKRIKKYSLLLTNSRVLFEKNSDTEDNYLKWFTCDQFYSYHFVLLIFILCPSIYFYFNFDVINYRFDIVWR